jgi:chaperonin GroES
MLYEDESMPEMMELPEGLELDEPKGKLEGWLDKGNLVDELEDNAGTATKIIELFNTAKTSMQDWLKKYKRAINLAKMQAMSGEKEITEKSFPFEGASLAMLPFVTEAMLDFNSRSAPELVWRKNIAGAKVYGQKTKEKEDRAKRITTYMDYQYTEEMPNWRDEQDKLLMILPCVGTAYKKTTYGYDKKVVRSDLYLADQIIFDLSNNNFYDAPDVFIERKYSRNELIGFIRGQQQWDVQESDLEDDKDSFPFIEAYTWIDLDDDGLKEPYTAILDSDTQKIVALYPYYDEDTITRNDKDEIISIDSVACFTQYRYLPDPEGGPMGLGWGILFGPMFESINTILRQLLDAGTLSNTAANSGLIAIDTAGGMGNSVQSGNIEIALGKLTPVNTRGASLRESVVQFPFAGPSQTLFQLMESLVGTSRSMTNASVNVESFPGEAAALYYARLKQGLKVPNAIFMRVYSAAKKESQKIALLNHKHFDDERYNRVLDDQQQASMANDFNPKDCDIGLSIDPSHGSDMERAQRAESVLLEAKTQPSQVLNLRQAYLEWLDALGHPDVESIAPEPDPNAVDPTMKLLMAEKANEAEMKKKDQELRETDLKLRTQKTALDAAREMTKLGLEGDKLEADITKTYMETLKLAYDMGINGGIPLIKQIEQTFIAEGGNNDRQIQTNNPSPVGLMVDRPSDPSIPNLSN